LGSLGGDYACGLLCDLLHPEGAEVLAEYGEEFYRGMPVLTRNRYGQGEAWYVASSPDASFLRDLAGSLCAMRGIKPLLEAAEGIEVSRRVKDGRAFLFILNHNHAAGAVDLGPLEQTELLSGTTMNGTVTLQPKDVLILEGPAL
ncbi:beta-galactosidase trimerization domain-containing protein, partial [Paenibacillus sepulcri]|nr:beta-galactosidase trimerization domain-containing protein [Paenibacillus sepulcri]